MRRLIRTIATATIALWGAAATAADPAPATEAPSQAQPPAPAPPHAQNQGTPATVLDTQDYESLLGKSVRAANGDDLGRIIDMVIDRDGRPRAAIIDFGGFLGVGSRKIAVEWRALKFTGDGKVGRLTLQLNRNQVRVSPEYKPGEPIVVLGPSSPSAPVEGDQAAAPAAPPPAAQVPAQVPAQAPAQVPAQVPAQAPAASPDKPADKPETKPER